MSDQPKPKNRGGRPRKAPSEGRRGNYSFRMTEALRDQVAQAAAANGRSLSEEVEFRIYEIFRTAELRTIVREEIEAALRPGITTRYAVNASAPVAIPAIARDVWHLS